MTRIFPIIKFRNTQDRYFLFLIIAIFCLPFQMNISASATGIFVLNALLSFPYKYLEKRKPYWLLYTLCFLFFISTAISLIYTENIDLGITKLQTKSSFLLLPVAFGIGFKQINFKRVRYLLRLFIFSVLLAIIYCFIESGIKLWHNGNWHELIGSYLSEPLIHRAYLSLFIGFAIFIWWDDISFLRKYRASGITFFTITLLLLQGRMNIIAFGIVVPILFFLNNYKTISKKQKLRSFVIAFLLIVAFIITPEKYNRFKAPFSFDYQIDAEDEKSFNAVTTRLAIWKNGTIIFKENFLLGVGVGDVEEKRREGYRKLNYAQGIKRHYNCHNQLLDSGISSGFLAPLLYLAIIVFYWYYAWKLKNYYLAAMATFFFLSSLTESLLERYWGIAVFTVVMPLYFHFAYLKTEVKD